MRTVCQRCEARGGGPSGICAQCGGVALYEERWSGSGGSEAPPTPLIESRTPGLEGVWLKVEGANLSGSFKDRVMRVLVDEAVGSGMRGAVVASSGNAAIAAASACARAQLPLLVLVPNAAAVNSIRMAELRGGVVVRAGEGPAAVHGLAKRLAARFGFANLASTFGAAGCEWACRGIGHEIASQMPGGGPAVLAASISVGPVLIGAGNGILEDGAPTPSLVAAQALGCAPIANAFRESAEEVQPWTGATETAALAIADRLTGYADEASFALRRVRETGGSVQAVSDDAMEAARYDLARYYGLDVELASCAAAAVLRTMTRRSHLSTVCILTGSGAKETLGIDSPRPSSPGLEGFAEATGGGAALLEEVKVWIHASR